jgi:RNA polymerase sigma-70 factor (ECF subfamily)
MRDAISDAGGLRPEAPLSAVGLCAGRIVPADRRGRSRSALDAPVDGEASRDPDADLVRRIGDGDARAARALVDRHLGRMLTLARRMLGDEAEAEDVAQEVFLRVWRSAARWRPGEAKFETWMHRVALNLCYDRLRRRREVVTDAPPERVDEGPNQQDAAEAADRSRRIEAALLELPERQRAAITLVHFEEMSNIEAAAALGVSVDALESLLARARRSLREALAGEAGALM